MFERELYAPGYFRGCESGSFHLMKKSHDKYETKYIKLKILCDSKQIELNLLIPIVVCLIKVGVLMCIVETRNNLADFFKLQ